MKILSIGSAILDKITFVDCLPKKDKEYDTFDLIEVGGCAANVAVGLAQLGLQSDILCSLGNDVDGDFIKEVLSSKGVSMRRVSQKEGRTGYCKAYVDNEAERTFFNYDGVNLMLDDTHVKKDIIASYSALYIAGYELLDTSAAKVLLKAIGYANEANVPVYFDPSPEIKDIPSEILSDVLSRSDYVILNRDEANAYGQTLNIELCAKMLKDHGAKNVIVKLGNEGCYFHNEFESFYEKHFEVDAVDTNGAGDAFMAGFIRARLHGYDRRESCKYANAVASIIVGEKGSQSETLSPERVEEVLANGKSR